MKTGLHSWKKCGISDAAFRNQYFYKGTQTFRMLTCTTVLKLATRKNIGTHTQKNKIIYSRKTNLHRLETNTHNRATKTRQPENIFQKYCNHLRIFKPRKMHSPLRIKKRESVWKKFRVYIFTQHNTCYTHSRKHFGSREILL